MTHFVLEFNLTFPVLRTSKTPFNDRRLKPDGTPLRTATDISFLSKRSEGGPDGNDEIEYIYEAGISCVVSGWDHWVWTAYMFIDTYYDKPENQESVQHYENLWKEEQGRYCPGDPLTSKNTALDRAIHQPREYWLRVLRVRVHQAVQESDIVVRRVKQNIEDYVRYNPFTRNYFYIIYC